MELKTHHTKSLKKALNILIDHLNENRQESAGWSDGYSVGGWFTADQLVTGGYFELSADAKKENLNSRRYRISQKGIEALIKVGDELKLKDGRTGTLRAFGPQPRNFTYKIEIAGVLEDIPLTALDIEPITAENAVLNTSMSYIATLTSPEPMNLGKSPYTTVTIPADKSPSPLEGEGEKGGEGNTEPAPVPTPEPATLTVETTYFTEPATGSAAAKLAGLINTGWEIKHEQFIVQDGALLHVARLERTAAAPVAPQPAHTHKPLSVQIDEAIEAALAATPDPDPVPVVVPDAIIGLDDLNPVSVGAVREQPTVPTFAQITEALTTGKIDLDQFSRTADALAYYNAGVAL